MTAPDAVESPPELRLNNPHIPKTYPSGQPWPRKSVRCASPERRGLVSHFWGALQSPSWFCHRRFRISHCPSSVRLRTSNLYLLFSGPLSSHKIEECRVSLGDLPCYFVLHSTHDSARLTKRAGGFLTTSTLLTTAFPSEAIAICRR